MSLPCPQQILLWICCRAFAEPQRRLFKEECPPFGGHSDVQLEEDGCRPSDDCPEVKVARGGGIPLQRDRDGKATEPIQQRTRALEGPCTWQCCVLGTLQCAPVIGRMSDD